MKGLEDVRVLEDTWKRVASAQETLSYFVKKLEDLLEEYFCPAFIGYDTLGIEPLTTILSLIDALFHRLDISHNPHLKRLHPLLLTALVPVLEKHLEEEKDLPPWQRLYVDTHRLLAHNLERQGCLADALLHYRKAFGAARQWGINTAVYQTAIDTCLQQLCLEHQIKKTLYDLPQCQATVEKVLQTCSPLLKNVGKEGITPAIQDAYQALLKCLVEQSQALFNSKSHPAISQHVGQWYTEALPLLKGYWRCLFQERIDAAYPQKLPSPSSNQADSLKALQEVQQLFKQDVDALLRFAFHDYYPELREWFKREVVLVNHKLPARSIDLNVLFQAPVSQTPAVTLSWLTWEEELTQARQLLSQATQSEVVAAQAAYSHKVRQLLKTLCQAIEQHLGPAPCTYEFLSIGSLSRCNMRVNSDVELIGLIEKAQCQGHPYFAGVISLLRALLISLGEPWEFNADERQYELQDLHIDTGQLEANGADWQLKAKFLQTPDAFAESLANAAKDAISGRICDVTLYSCLAATPFYSTGEETPLAVRYYQALGQCQLRGKTKLLRTLAYHFCQHHQTAYALDKNKADIKESILKPLQHWIIDATMYHGLDQPLLSDKEIIPCTPLTLLEHLQEAGHLQPAISDLLKHMYAVGRFSLQVLPSQAFLEILYHSLKVSWEHAKVQPEALSHYFYQPLHRQHSKDWQAVLSTIPDLEPALPLRLKRLPNLWGERVSTLEELAEFQASLCALGEPVESIPKQSQDLQAYLQWTNKALGEQMQLYAINPLYLKQVIDSATLGIKNTMKDNHRHCVAAICFTDKEGKSHALHIKEKPDQPMMDYAIYELRQRLFGHGSPPNTLARLTVVQGNKRHSLPVLISRSVGQTEDNLLYQLNHKPQAMLTLDLQAYYEMVLFDMLTCPGDGAPRNFQVQAAEGRLFCIDNEQYFVNPISQGLLKKTVQLCSILFSFDTMQKANSPALAQALAGLAQLDIKELLKRWLDELTLQEIAYLKLFSSAERRQLFQEDREQRRFIASLLLPEGAVFHLANGLLYLQALAQLEPGVPSAADILHTLHPVAGLYYIAQLKQLERNPISRLSAVSQSALATSSQSLQACFGKIPDHARIEAQLNDSIVHDYCAAQAKLELQVLPDEAEGKTSKKTFTLTRIDKQYQLFLDFQTCPMGENEQKQLLKKIAQRCYGAIHIHHCKVLDDALLMLILENSKSQLTELSLSHCPKLTNPTIGNVAAACPQLTRLRLVNNPGLTEVKPQGFLLFNSAISFPKLHYLHLSANEKLITLQLSLPKLQVLKLSKLPALTQLKILAPHLQQLRLIHCENLPLENCTFELSLVKAVAVDITVTQCSKLVEVETIADCPKLLLLPAPASLPAALNALQETANSPGKLIQLLQQAVEENNQRLFDLYLLAAAEGTLFNQVNHMVSLSSWAERKVELDKIEAALQRNYWGVKRIVLMGPSGRKIWLYDYYYAQQCPIEWRESLPGADFFRMNFVLAQGNQYKYRLEIWNTPEQSGFSSMIKSECYRSTGIAVFISQLDDIERWVSTLILDLEIPYVIVYAESEKDRKRTVNLPSILTRLGENKGKLAGCFEFYFEAMRKISLKDVNTLFTEIFTSLLTYQPDQPIRHKQIEAKVDPLNMASPVGDKPGL